MRYLAVVDDVAGLARLLYTTRISHAPVNTVCDISQCIKRILMLRRASSNRVKAFTGLALHPIRPRFWRPTEGKYRPSPSLEPF
jgi:hypothetical protein